MDRLVEAYKLAFDMARYYTTLRVVSLSAFVVASTVLFAIAIKSIPKSPQNDAAPQDDAASNAIPFYASMLAGVWLAIVFGIAESQTRGFVEFYEGRVQMVERELKLPHTRDRFGNFEMTGWRWQARQSAFSDILISIPVLSILLWWFVWHYRRIPFPFSLLPQRIAGKRWRSIGWMLLAVPISIVAAIATGVGVFLMFYGPDYSGPYFVACSILAGVVLVVVFRFIARNRGPRNEDHGGAYAPL
ncbi:MAG: hypothetical protein JWM11_3139 [Planctomycetaceae bacterium]|nr:hypothetical protein [Planctomycetaceae bacterium]